MTVNSTILALITFSILFWNNSTLALTRSQKINLHLGEQKEIHETNISRISVDRRGLVHIVQKSPSLWQLTATRSGIAVIRLYSQKSADKVLYVNVLPRIPESHKTKTNVINSPTFPPAEKSRRIYIVKVNLELVESQSTESKGIPVDAGIHLDVQNKIANTKFAGDYSPRLETKTRNIIGSPVYTTMDAEETSIKSGGEIKFEQSGTQEQKSSAWHEFGMSLTTKIEEIDTNSVLTKVQFVLKNPTGGNGSFSLNQIDTTTILAINKMETIGIAELASDDLTHEENPIISKIPIIGPIFQHKSIASAKAKLRLWLEINRKE